MKKTLLLLSLCVMGCANVLGQWHYTGKAQEPVIKERIVHLPQTPAPGMRSGGLADYYSLPVDKVVEVSNPWNTAIKVKVKCVCSFPSEFDEVVVPPHTTQEMLLTTNATYMYQTLCEMTFREE